MWGIWILLVGGAVGVVFLGMALAFGAAPLFALLVFVLFAAGAGAAFMFKRGAEYTHQRDEELAREDSRAGTEREIGSAV
jgi:hypothetical protein